jgi:CBS domain-containing protein
MVTPVVSFHPTDPLRKVVDVLLRRGFSGAPITDSSGRVVGILSELDCMRWIAGRSYDQEPNALGITVADVMSDPCALAHPEMDLFGLVHLFLNAGVRRLPVVADEHLVGIVTRRDVLRVIRDHCG